MISVIINVYNGEKYIKKCLDSIINQTYRNIEILIINDGSVDNTLDIIKQYKDKRIRIINQKNIGLSLSRNVGIENSKGDYLYFVDVDDFIEKDTLEYLYKLSKKYNADLVTCKPLDIYNYDTKIKNDSEKIEVLTNIEMLKKTLINNNREGTFWNKLFKKELLNEIRFENKKVNDVRVTYKAVLNAKKIVYSNQYKYYYYRHNDSIISLKKTDYLKDLYDATIERYNYINNIYPKLLENDITLLLMIVNLYYENNKELNNYLDKKNAKELFKKIYSRKIYKSNLLRYNDKIKLKTFKINPKLMRGITKTYLKIKKKK